MNKKNNKRKVLQFICLLIIVLALFVSIIFSSFGISSNTLFNTRYEGGYKALVEVYDSNNDLDEGSASIANGDASKAASSLEAKLSPFSDNTVDIKVVGQHRLSVSSTKQQYGNNQDSFKTAIEQDGGILALTTDYKDILFDDTTMNKVTGSKVFDDEGKITNKIAISDIFGTAKYVSSSDPTNQQKNAAFLTFQDGKKSDYLSKLTSASTTDTTSDSSSESSTPQSLTLISSMQTVINNVRNYYSMYEKQDELDDYLLSYYKGVIQPMQTLLDSATDTKEEVRRVINDLFTINYKVSFNGEESTETASLVGNDLVFYWNGSSNNNHIGGSDSEVVAQLKGILYGISPKLGVKNISENPQASFANTADKYVIDPNSVTTDFTEDGGKYNKDFQLTEQWNTKITQNEASDIVNENLLKNIIFADIDSTKTDQFYNKNFRQDLFDNNFIMINDQITTASVTPDSANNYSKSVVYNNNELKVRMKSATIAKSIEASISQTTSGFSFKVIRIEDFKADINLIMIISSSVCLIILAIIAIVYLLYFYRLLGLYTLIIAVTSVFLTILIPTFFGIAIGVEMIIITFIVLAITIDSCVTLIETFKKHLNKDKRSQAEALKLSNKENASTIFDLILLITVPNIILFWVSSGSLKNFATIAVSVIFITLIMILVIFRLMFWLTIKGNILKNNPKLLPLDTSILKDSVEYRKKFKVLQIDYKLKKIALKNKVESKDLIKIKKLNDYKEKLILQIIKKEELHSEAKIKKETSRLTKLNKKIEKQKDIKKTKNLFIWFINLFKKDYQDYLNTELKYSQAVVNKDSAENIVVAKQQRQTKRSLVVSKILVITTLFLSIIGSILAGTLGPSYSSDFGRDNVFIVYGDYVDNFPNKIDDVIEHLKNLDSTSADKLEKIKQDIEAEAKANNKEYYSDELAAATIKFIYDNNLMMKFSSKNISKIGNVEVSYGEDYLINESGNSSDKQNTKTGWIQLKISNRSSLSRNKLLLKRILVNLNALQVNNEVDNNSEHAFLGMNQIPFTAVGQVEQILITFGILLLALIVYILIRFKWTYYVALALGIVIVGAITTSLIIVFRVPISYELLSTLVAVISFAILTIVMILGKIRSSISAKSKDQLSADFDNEIKIKSYLHHKVLELRTKISKIKITKSKEFKIQKRKILEIKLKKIKRFEIISKIQALFIFKKSDEIKAIKLQIKKIKKDTKKEIHLLKKEIKVVKKENNKAFAISVKTNDFMKNILIETINNAVNKFLIIGSFYLIFALILIFTIPSIVGVGLTLFIGILITYIFTLTIAVPLTVALEKRRIARRFASRDFIKVTHISQEEQIVKDIND